MEEGAGGGQTNTALLKKVKKINLSFRNHLYHILLCPGRDTNAGTPSIQSKKLPLLWQRAMNHGIDDAPLQGDK